MKRRDLLKATGALMLGAPALRASALSCPTQPPLDLVVTFDGPFCFWQETQDIKVMVPPVGPDCHGAEHQPWFGTTTNQIAVNVDPGTNLTLAINGYVPPTDGPCRSGTSSFDYEQGAGKGSDPLFNLFVPIPDIIIGVRPTAAKMICAPGVTDPYCTQFAIYCSGWSFVYQNVNLNGVAITGPDPSKPPFFTPCFTNDASLKEATLGVHLTPLDRHPDPEHKHAKKVWSQMLSMYPWMQTEINGIDFCANFDPGSCNFDPAKCISTPKPGHKHPLMVGPGSDCEAPIMGLNPPGSNPRRRKR
ncbi:MAG TPA: hypothetical protein VK738_05245 [Terriglobales bacterium]|nr:hypothetical protein [Terriglobales bacterium]